MVIHEVCVCARLGVCVAFWWVETWNVNQRTITNRGLGTDYDSLINSKQRLLGVLNLLMCTDSVYSQEPWDKLKTIKLKQRIGTIRQQAIELENNELELRRTIWDLAFVCHHQHILCSSILIKFVFDYRYIVFIWGHSLSLIQFNFIEGTKN